MENQEPTNRNLIQSRVSRRTALKAGGIAALGLAFSKPLIQTIYPQPAFAQLSSAGLPGNDTTPDPQGQPLIAGCNPNGWVLDSQFSNPRWANDIAIDSAGNIYIADLLIRKYDANGNFVTQWGEGEDSLPGMLDESGSHGLVVAPNGKLYVSDHDNGRIQVFDTNGNYLFHFGKSGPGELEGPRGIACDSLGYIYVADTEHWRIVKFNPNGVYVTHWGSEGTGNGQWSGFNGPEHIATDGAGKVYVADVYGKRVQVFDSNGNWLSNIVGTGVPFTGPYGVEADNDGLVYISDSGNIHIFSPGGAYLATISGEHGSMARPAGCSLYLASLNDYAIKKFVQA